MVHYLVEMQIKIMDKENLDNNQEPEENKTISEFEKKIKDLLNELDVQIEQIGDDYGPILMEELQNRLVNVLKKFNFEVNELFTNSFKRWKVTDTQLRELIKRDVEIPKNNISPKIPKTSKTPKFIKDVNFGPLRPK